MENNKDLMFINLEINLKNLILKKLKRKDK